MNRLLRLAFVVLLVSISGVAFAQGGGITGTLKDEKGNPVVNANVEVTSGGIVSGRDLTDFDGNYTIKPLNGGRYEVKFSYLGFTRIYTDVSVTGSQLETVNGKIVTSTVLNDVKIVRSKVEVPLLNLNKPGGSSTKPAEVIEKTATRTMDGIAGLTAQVYSGGGGLNIGGARTSGTKYVVDGVEIHSFTNLPPNSVESITTYTSGVPAKFGDASGGLVSATTKGSTAKTQGSFQFEHSLDGYNNNQLTMNLSGPLLRKKDSMGAYRPIIGYTLTADGIMDADQSPVYFSSPVVNADKLTQLQNHPLTIVNVNGIQRPEYSANFLYADDINYQKKRTNINYYRGQLAGKLDFHLTDNMSLRVGGNYNRNDAPNYSQGLALLSPDAYQRTQNQKGTGYVRFTQKFGNKLIAKGGTEKNQITNAFYTVQVDYTQEYGTTQDKNFKHNTFNYGYVGKFDEQYMPIYKAGKYDDSSGKVGVGLAGYVPINVVFTPGGINPLLENYTKDAYSYNSNPFSQSIILSNKGLRNGDGPAGIYGLYSNVGASGSGGWSQNAQNQIGLSVDASFDIKHNKTTHSIEFGLGYQQRNLKSYSISGASLWNMMRLYSNRVVGQEVDPLYAHYIINGVSYTLADVRAGKANPSPNDTILYDRKFDQSAETKFDSSMRVKLLGLGKISSMKDYVNTDLYDPSFYSLDMFSADDLFNQGSSAVRYFGYDYTGKLLTGNVNFTDFWTAKDANGYLARPIAAYRPNMISAYLSDYIQYKDFRLTFGVRVERFDNATKVLKDPYSLYAVKTVGSITGTSVPGNIPSTAVPYVGNNTVPNSAVIGYRNDDTWYDASGREVADPKVLQTGTGSNSLQPVLQNATARMSDANFDANNSFTDYKPQVHAMPRINFSFPLSDNALFYAHYDVMYQRPTTGAYALPTDYLFITQNPSSIYSNSNLLPERAIDYEVGFQQKLTDNSGLTISGFYKERRDQIQIRPYLYAFPITYFAYGNRDFSTYKGLSVNYELRRTGHISMSVNYTLSFSEGTGSGPSSANGGSGSSVNGNSLLSQLIAAGLPNLRTQFPLDYDSRHNINVQLDYRFRDGEGPTIGNHHILENSGINFVMKYRSGEPYTKYSTAQNLTGAGNSPVIDGTVNGSRLNGHFGLDVNIDKSIPLSFHKLKDGEIAKPSHLALNIYMFMQNALNIKDITSVYGYTGRANDDGFLTSPQGLTMLPSMVDSKSFTDLYNISMNNPYRYGAPRTIVLGLRLNF